MTLSQVACVVLVMLLGGCASIEAVRTNQGLLGEYRQVGNWSPQQTKKKLAMLEDAYNRLPSDENRLRLAVVHGFGNSEDAQQTWALDLFKMTQASAPNSTTGALAALFIDVLETRKALAKSQQELAKIRQDAEQSLADVRLSLKKERWKVKALEKKLKAVTTIEKSLHLRD